jgi:hypothetical protein
MSAIRPIAFGIAVAAVSVAATASSATAAQPTLAAVYGVTAGRTLTVSGRAPSVGKGRTVQLETRTGKRANTRKSAKTKRGGNFTVAWKYPKGTRRMVVRVRVKGLRSAKSYRVVGAWKTITVRKTMRARPIAKMKPSQITTAPPTDAPGQMVLSGKTAVKVGEVIVLGVTPATPSGLLVRATDVDRSGGQTVVKTEPASLPDVIPVGEMDVQLPEMSLPESATGRSAGRKASGRSVPKRLDKAFSCSGTATAAASASVSLSTSTALEASWRPWSGLKAKFSGTVGADANLAASVSGQASCTLESTNFFESPVGLGTYRFSIAGIPLVLQPFGQIYLSGSANAEAQMSTNATASVKATAGIKYEDDRFEGFGSVTPTISHTPPAMTATGTATVSAAPAVYVKINGIGGPEIDMKTSLNLAADKNANPWWSLTAGLDLGARFKVNVWKLNKTSDRISIASKTFPIANAGGPLAAPVPPAAEPTPEPPAPPATPEPRTRALMTWSTETDVDLYVWDDQGSLAYFGRQDGIPGARLVEDVIPGYGPEEFQEFEGTSQHYTYGVCSYAGGESDVALTVHDPDGQQRTIQQHLNYTGDYAIVASSPEGNAYNPGDDWCRHADY